MSLFSSLDENCKAKYRPLKTRRYHATRTISDVKKVADDRVSNARDMKTDSVMFKPHGQRSLLLVKCTSTRQLKVGLSDQIALSTNTIDS